MNTKYLFIYIDILNIEQKFKYICITSIPLMFTILQLINQYSLWHLIHHISQ